MIKLERQKRVTVTVVIWGALAAYGLGLVSWIIIWHGRLSELWLHNVWPKQLTAAMAVSFGLIGLSLWSTWRRHGLLEREMVRRLRWLVLGWTAGLALLLLPLPIPGDNWWHFLVDWQGAYESWLTVVLAWWLGWFWVWFPPVKWGKQWQQWWQAPRLYLGVIGAAAAVYILAGLALHRGLGTSAFDLGIFDQAVWNIAYNHSLANSVSGYGNSLDHFSPILILLAPGYWLWNDARMLIIMEVVAVAAGAIPLYHLAQKRFSRTFLSLALVIAYLGFLGNQMALAFPFHASTLIAPLLLAAYYFLEEKKWGWHWLMIGLALLTKENIGIYLAVLGLVLLLVKREYRWLGVAYMALGFGWVMITTKYILPALINQPYPYFGYEVLGTTPLAALTTAISNPFYALAVLWGNGEKVATFLWLLAGSGFLAVSWPYGLLLLPTLGEKLLSGRTLLWGTIFHYGAPMSFGLALATMATIGRGREWLKRKHWSWLKPDDSLRLAGVVLIVATVMVTLNQRTLPMQWLRGKIKPFNNERQLQEAVRLIPPTGSVSAQYALVPHLSHRSVIYQYPEIKEANSLLLVTNGGTYPLTERQYRNQIRELLASDQWGLVYSQGDILLWQRGRADAVTPAANVVKYILGDN